MSEAPVDEIQQTIPIAPEAEHSIAHLVRLLEGYSDKDGNRRKGVIDRLEIIEEREAAREKARLEREAQRRMILVGLGLASFGTFVTQIANWINAHIK